MLAALCLWSAPGLLFVASSDRLLEDGICSLAWAAPAPAAAKIDPGQDARIESLLGRGRIVRTEKTKLGVTNPLRVWVEEEGESISGCFKYVDLQSKGITRIQGGEAQLNFTDRHIFDQAAYRLDRELGMDMVPVAVSRRVRGLRGTLVHWLDDVVDETERLKRSLPPEAKARIHRQKGTMLVFDALIDNVDRNAGNLLYTADDWNLYLIDHTRAFHNCRQLSERFLERSLSLPRPFYDRLRELDAVHLRKVLKGVLSKILIQAMLARRDLIVEMVEAQRQLRGDEAVFQADDSQSSTIAIESDSPPLP